MSTFIHIVKMRATNDLVIYLVVYGTKSRLQWKLGFQAPTISYLGLVRAWPGNLGHFDLGRAEGKTVRISVNVWPQPTADRGSLLSGS